MKYKPQLQKAFEGTTREASDLKQLLKATAKKERDSMLLIGDLQGLVEEQRSQVGKGKEKGKEKGNSLNLIVHNV